MGAPANISADTIGIIDTELSVKKQTPADNLRLWIFLDTLIPLLVLSLLAYSLKIEENLAFLKLLPLLLGGFAIHYWLPDKIRMPFFVFLSAAAFCVAMGPQAGLLLIVASLLLIGICHLPISMLARVVFISGIGLGLAYQRADLYGSETVQVVTLYLGSIFMFRLAVYLYDLRHETEVVSPWQRLAYFCLFPNAAFTLFPVVDYQTFKSTYEASPSYQTYQTGLRWIFRGMIQLLLYRLAYYWIVIPEADVRDMVTLCQFILSSYLLYLRVSGIFHITVGILHLFGFNLPETHHLYFLAANFTDLWRRINIYWKDFMMKLFFYPAFMRFRRLGIERAIIIATLWVFFWTTILHSYQWFWLRGTFVLSATDAVFWSILGILVAINSIQESRKGRKRSLGSTVFSWQAATIRSATTLAMFVTMCLLWSIWSAETLLGVIATLSTFWYLNGYEYVGLVVFLAVLIGIGTGFQYIAPQVKLKISASGASPSLGSSLSICIIALGLFALGIPQWQARLLDPIADVVRSISENRLNRQDMELVERGYYENILGKAGKNSQAWDLRPVGDRDWRQLAASGAYQATGDLYEKELTPDATVRVPGKGVISINQWGMRDREYELIKPAHVWRMAHLGVSIPMGLGVRNEDVFEELVEDRLNREGPHQYTEKYESMNFAIGSSYLIQHVAMVEDRLLPFKPDAVLYHAHDNEVSRSLRGFAHLLPFVLQRFPELDEITKKANILPGMDLMEIMKRLNPSGDEIMSWSYGRLAATAKAGGAVPVLVFWPGTEEPVKPEELQHISRIAREAGMVVLDLTQAYNGYELRDLRISRWDKHPNVEGHQIFADRLFRALLDHQKELRIDQSREQSEPPLSLEGSANP